MLGWADQWKVVINIDYYNCNFTLAPTWDWFAWIDNALIGFSLLYLLFLMASIKVKKKKKSTKANDSGSITISFYVLNFSTQLKKHLSSPSQQKIVQLLQLELWLFNGGETIRMALLIIPQRPHTFSRLLCLILFKKES